jgi:hypothetical protein
MTKDDRIKLYLALAAPFPEAAVERTDGAITGRGYSTTGIKYQYLADRLNEVLGVGGFRTERTITVKGVTSAKGRQGYEAIAEVRLELGEWIDGAFVVIAQAWGDGGHTAVSEADARKGAYTNAFKKAAAFLGAGRDAYRGTIDDDHVPANDDAPLPPHVDDRQAEAPPRTALPAAVAIDVASMKPLSPAQPIRNRLTSKQFSALRSLSRTAGHDDRSFKEEVRRRYGTDVAYLSSRQASELIGELLASTNGHGAREAG